MLITRKSCLTGKTHTLDIDITLAQYKAWEDGAIIQKIAPHLSADDREFIISGCTAEEWDDLFAGDEE